MRRVLLLRPSGDALPGADLLVTHRVAPDPDAVAAFAAEEPLGAILVVSSRSAVEVLRDAPQGNLLARPFRLVVSAGAGTTRALEAAGVAGAVTPELPGAAGILAELARRCGSGRLLWPRGSDADAAPVAELAARGFDVSAPVVYLKEPLPALDAERLRAFRAGEYGAVAVGSLAALDVFLAALGAEAPDDLPPVRFGVLGPESARLLVARGFPEPLVPEKPLLTDLIALLKEACPMAFPLHRYRRLRLTESLRAMVRETTLDPADFIAPMFVVPGEGIRQPIPSMPGVDRVSVDLAAKDAAELAARGVLSVILFGIPDHKDAVGTSSADLSGPVCRAASAIKKASPATVVMTDVCLCEYTDHGHCGVIVDRSVDNDATLPILAAEALAHAKAGADVVAPSDMMDGRVRAIREALDGSGFRSVPVLSYAAKYASGFYGPFREAAESTPAFGDRRAYQMDPANVREAVKEILSDVEEGADMVMVKPALSYLDVVRAAKEATNVPVATYNVSGEYAMVKAAAERGWIDGKRVTLEILTSMKRAGADLILTYHAKEAAEWLQGR